jgi:hypothetical protein
MPITNAAMNLADYAALRNDELLAGVVLSLHNAGSVLQDMSFVTTGTGAVRGARFTHEGLPTPTFRKLNDDTTTVRATPNAYSESAFILSNNIDVDRVQMTDSSIAVNPVAAQLEAYLAGASRVIDDRFINNSPLTGDADAPVGLRYRLDNPSAFGAKTALKRDFGAVDISPANLTVATANNFLRQLGQLLQEMGAPNGNGLVLYMNEDMAEAMAAALRLLGVGGWGFREDAFGLYVTTFRGATVRVLGRGVDGTTRVITSTETSAGANGSSTHTSIYAVRYGEGYFQPWQQNPIQVTNWGLIPGQNYHRVNVEWPFGWLYQSEYSIARGFGIKIA